MFEGSRRRKAQVLVHNIKPLRRFVKKRCLPSKVCSRTGKPNLTWKPRVRNGRVTLFATGDEREYPLGFFTAYASGISQAIFEGFPAIFFVSGPNAPVSREVSLSWGIPPPAKAGRKFYPGKEHSETSELKVRAG